MRTELRLVDHQLLPGVKAVEVWYGDKMIATIYGADGPGVKFISKYEPKMRWPEDMVTEIFIDEKSLG